KGKNNLLILCDGGGSNGCRNYVFKQAIQKFADSTGLTIRIAHYPAYCSKYNPIEHRVFPHLTRALSGFMLDTVQTVKQLIEQRAKTKTGLKVVANIIHGIYEKGKKATKEFLENMPIVFDEFLPKWNYVAVPRE
ncbi:MAG: ISAzo13-like element transposase-related protein, partial [Chitinophagales bacterium]